MPKEINNQSICENNFEIEFEEETHTYKVDGKRLPSVSEIMRPLSEDYYKDLPKEILNKAAERGKRVHLAIELYDVFGVEDDSKEVKPYLLGYKMARSLEHFQPKHSEIRLTNGEYCGTLDMLALEDGKNIIIDLKATSKINIELLEVQLAAYQELANFNGYSVDKLYCLHIKPNGYKYVQIVPNELLWQELKKQWRNKYEN